jgi:hypothetical protein
MQWLRVASYPYGKCGASLQSLGLQLLDFRKPLTHNEHPQSCSFPGA